MKPTHKHKPFEVVILVLPAFLLAALGIIMSNSGVNVSRPDDALGFITKAMSLRQGRDVVVVFLAIQALLSVAAVVAMFLQMMIDKVPPPFEKPHHADNNSSYEIH